MKSIPQANHTVAETGNSQDEVMKDLNNSNKVRRNLAPKISTQIKHYDIVKFRDYLRILRRLWNLSQLHDGKEEEIIRVHLDQPHKPIIHPYFKNIDSKLYGRIYLNMGINNIREN